jgi:hypothetical protein
MLGYIRQSNGDSCIRSPLNTHSTSHYKRTFLQEFIYKEKTFDSLIIGNKVQPRCRKRGYKNSDFARKYLKIIDMVKT